MEIISYDPVLLLVKDAKVVGKIIPDGEATCKTLYKDLLNWVKSVPKECNCSSVKVEDTSTAEYVALSLARLLDAVLSLQGIEYILKEAIESNNCIEPKASILQDLAAMLEAGTTAYDVFFDGANFKHAEHVQQLEQTYDIVLALKPYLNECGSYMNELLQASNKEFLDNLLDDTDLTRDTIEARASLVGGLLNIVGTI